MATSRFDELFNQLSLDESDEVPETTLDEFVALLHQPHENVDEFQKQFAHSIGDLARQEHFREPIGARDVIQHLAKFGKTSSSPDVYFEIARAIGNLCYDQQNNRKRSFEAGAVDLFMNLVNREERNVQKVVCGALANLADQTDYIQEKLSSSKETLQRLVHLCRVPPQPESSTEGSDPTVMKELDVQMMASRALNNIGSTPLFIERIVSAGAVDVLMEILHSPPKITSPTVLIEAINALTTLCSHSQNGVRFIEEGGLVHFLDILANPDLPFDVHDAGCTFLVEFSENDEIRTKMTNSTEILNKLVASLSVGDEKKKKNYAKVLSNLSLNESNVQSLFAHLNTFIECLSSEDLNSKVTASTVIGNLARTDENCLKLMETSVVDLMLKNLTSSDDIRLHCVTLGALRNLSLLPSNKPKLIQKGIIPLLVKALSNENDHVKYASIGTIKILSTSNPGVCTEFVENGLYSPLLSISSKTEEGHDPRVQFEAARVVSIYSGFRQFRFELLQNGAVPSQVALLNSEYVVLQHEGAKSLSEFAGYGQFHEEIRKAGAIPRLVQLAVSENKTDPNNPNATFLNPPEQSLITLSLLASTESCLTEIVSEAVVELRQNFLSSTHPTIVTELKNTPQLIEALSSVTKTKEERWPTPSPASSGSKKKDQKNEHLDENRVLL